MCVLKMPSMEGVEIVSMGGVDMVWMGGVEMLLMGGVDMVLTRGVEMVLMGGVDMVLHNYFLLLSYLKCSVKVRKFVLYEFATKRAESFLLKFFKLFTQFECVNKNFVSEVTEDFFL